MYGITIITKEQHRFCVWSILVFSMGWTTVAGAEGREKANVALDADGRAFTFAVPGTMDFKGSFSATIVSGMQTRELLSTMGQAALPAGQTQELHSAAGKLFAPVEESSEETPCGRASVTEVTLRFEKEQVDLLFRLSRIAGLPGMQAQAGLRNTGSAPVRLLSVTPVALEGQVEGNPTEWLVTALDMRVKEAPPVVALNEIQKPLRVFEYGGFYRGDGNGFLFGPVGAPIAYVQASFAHQGQGSLSFTYTAEMSGVQVNPGETRWGQQVALLAEPPRAALPRWTDWVAKTHQARTDKGALSGWNSWSFHEDYVTGKDVLAEVDAVLNSQQRLRPSVMEIDAGFRSTYTMTNSYKNFPEGSAFYAQRIAATGARPGLLMNFFGPPGFDMLAARIRAEVQNGFTDIKINRTGFSFQHVDIPVKTSFEVMREGFATLREAAGQGTYLLYNVGRPERASVGLMDANRTAPSTSRQSLRDAIPFVLASYHLNGRWFAIDPNSYYMGTDIANVSAITGGWPLVRTWMSMVGLSCGSAITADPWHWESFRPYWRNVEVMTPQAKEQTEVLDLCVSSEWPRLVGHVKRTWGDMHVALLWNPGTSERTVTLDFAKVGMHPQHRYAVWSFWDNRYLGVTQGSWTTPALGPSASQHLCFTDLDLAPAKPVLIGSGLHIYCGAAEVKHIVQRRDAMDIELTDAGARNGDLFVYSRWQPVLKSAIGCAVSGIVSAGENVWRISLADRVCGGPQRLTLAILLPVTWHIWFWVLCGVICVSLLFGGWKYVAWSRAQLALAGLQQQTVRQQERARIAADLHDELGTSLAQIAMLGNRAQRLSTGDAEQHERLSEIYDRARESVRRLDEIVWAVNPARDSLEHLVSYLCKYSEEYLALADVRFRIDIPDDLPSVPLDSAIRHNIFLAVREAIHNAVRHGHPNTVTLRVVVETDCFTVTILDDGKGFDVALALAAGRGVANIRERMAHVGGELHLTSQPGIESVVLFVVPFNFRNRSPFIHEKK
jgi:alpha-galactosidase